MGHTTGDKVRMFTVGHTTGVKSGCLLWDTQQVSSQDVYCGTHNRRQGQDVYCGTHKRQQGQDVYCGTHNRRQVRMFIVGHTTGVKSECLLWDTQQA